MTVIETMLLLGAFAAGLMLGIIFFGGLWLTIRLALSSAMFGVWLFASFLFRAMIALAGIYFVFSGHWQRLIACLLGFFAARFIVTRVSRAQHPSERTGGLGDPHAP